jgi:O-succinylbenzoic acid--CoA ligase
MKETARKPSDAGERTMDGSERSTAPDAPAPMQGWQARAPIAQRRELHFGDRVLTCIADRPATMHAMLTAACAAHPGADAVTAVESRLTHGALHARGAEVAAGLAALGVGRGDRVAALLGNRAAFIEVMIACLRLGAVMLPLNPRYAPPEIAYAVNDAGAKILLFEADMADALPAPADTPGLGARIPVGDAPLFAGAGPAPDPTPADEEEACFILYTSGTTGRPKGAMLTNLNLVHSVLHFQVGMGLHPGDRTILSVPAGHVTGLVANILALLSVGGAVIVQRAFKARALLELIAAERATHTLMVPAMYQLCLMDEAFDSFDLSSWRLGGFGGAPMPVPTIEALAVRVPTLSLQQAYGATETTSPATLMPIEATRTRPNAVGQPLHCAEIAIMDDAGREVPRGEVGELWIRGPMVVPGYWNRPDANAAEFAAGFWKSGDLGRMDASGFVEVLDRKKDMINRGGYKIFSSEVENVLARHPSVAECAVLGYPCEVLGERVRAVITLAPGWREEDAAPELQALAAANLADFRRPERWSFGVDPLPRNANGKVLKTALRDAAAP